ncbi:MAG TPA: hypothetical protein VKZ96_11320 [Thermomicrobiales bacterium]|nr:hypothetical protein [Steroidobacteraceae bacterium]HLT20038.1 hypothetical protein [Thermomicrobiales bacterium]
MTRRPWTLIAPVFAIVYGGFYVVKQPVFIYYPLHDALTLERLAPEYGPGMLWYGWLTAGALVAAAAAWLAPARWAARVPPAASGAAVLGVMILIVIEELRGLFS